MPENEVTEYGQAKTFNYHGQMMNRCFRERTQEILFIQVERDDELSNLDEDKRRVYFSRTSFAGILICSYHISDTKSTGTRSLGCGTG